MAKLRSALALVVAFAVVGLAAPAAHADTVTGVGTTSGNRYRGGVPTAPGVYFASSVQVARNAKGEVTNVRGAGRVTKIRGAKAVQVDRVALGTSTRALAVSKVPANSGTAPTVLSVTDWVRVGAGSCISYRVRTDYSVRWDDGASSAFSILSPLTKVCGPTPPAPPKPPAQPGRPANPGNSKDCGDFATYAQAYAWYSTYYPYYGDVARLDADGDGIPCERLPGAP